jgi:hypothetical protein
MSKIWNLNPAAAGNVEPIISGICKLKNDFTAVKANWVAFLVDKPE